MLLTPAELAIFRTTQLMRFDLTATIERPGGTEDSSGGFLPGSPTTFTSPCCITPHRAAQQETLVGAELQGQALWDISFPALTDIKQTDQITVDGQGYEVVSLQAPKSRETARVVLCVERGFVVVISGNYLLDFSEPDDSMYITLL